MLRIISGKANFAVCHDDDSSYQRLRSVRYGRRNATATATTASKPQSRVSQARRRVIPRSLDPDFWIQAKDRPLEAGLARREAPRHTPAARASIPTSPAVALHQGN